MFFVETEVEYNEWISILKQTIGQRKLSEHYYKQEQLGEGSFGKVFKGRAKASE